MIIYLVVAKVGIWNLSSKYYVIIKHTKNKHFLCYIRYFKYLDIFDTFQSKARKLQIAQICSERFGTAITKHFFVSTSSGISYALWRSV